VTDRELMKALAALDQEPNTKEDWRDLYETIEAYQRRRLARAIARHPDRRALTRAIKVRAEGEDEEVEQKA
jgi:hypothetical protein